MSDDYTTVGKPLAELYDIEQDDPWQTFEAKEYPPLPEILEAQWADFVDPDNDDDPTITDQSMMSLFWRITVPGIRLSEVVSFVPELPKIGLTLKNFYAGCWVAFTSRKVAMRVAATLEAWGMLVVVVPCDIHGVGHPEKFEDTVQVKGARPWNKNSDDEDLSGKEFFYCIASYDDEIRAHFVPETFWNAHQMVFDGDLGLDELLENSFKITDLPCCYVAWRDDMAAAKRVLDHLGFRENLMFQAYVNEQSL